jgi:signal transduction histidine kinase/CheY-like chemotaxis protein
LSLRRGRLLSRADNLSAPGAARLSVPIRRKLMMAFAAVVILLVATGLLGLRVLGQSNDRVRTLGLLQQRAATYQGLQINNNQLRQMRLQRSSELPAYVGADPAQTPASSGPGVSDDEIEATLNRLRRAYDFDTLAFTPPADEARTLSLIQSDYAKFAAAMTQVVALHRAGKTAESQQLLGTAADPVASRLETNTDLLVEDSQTKTGTLIDQSQDDYEASRRLFAGFAFSGVALALLLGFALSRSIIGPVQRMNTRLAEIALGDFSGRVEVANRDELGVLAENLNRMNDELGRLYHDLEAASRHKSEFLASMSHELRTPLNAIIGFSEVLLQQMFGPVNERQADYLSDILTSGRHLLSLINDILDLSKIEAGKMELDLGEFAMPAVLESGLTMVRERAANHGITLGLEVGPEVGTVRADERKIKQVVFNLLSNAVKFTPDGGRIDVACHCRDDRLEVSVKDTGIGIAPADQERIFDEFQQAGQLEGSGLGLALARTFVALHGGDLRVESEPGNGSTFTFTLPLQPDSSPTVQPAELPGLDVAAGTPGPDVLLIEDDDRSAELLTIYLEGAGYTVTRARDGEQGTELARQLHPAAIVLDLMLPGLSGWDVLAQAKLDPELSRIPVVIVSMLDEQGKGYALGAADYLVKPVRGDDLLAALRPLTGVVTAAAPGTVLAVDDDPTALELIDAVLGPEGYTVLRAAGGPEALQLARQEQPALVILDLLMPGMDGFDVVEALRADPLTAQIPIVILTSKSLEAADLARLNSQVAHLANKGSFSRAEFVELVKRCHRAPVT